MVLVALSCPFCGSTHVGKNGFSNGKQRYVCKNSACSQKTFYAEYTYYLVKSNFAYVWVGCECQKLGCRTKTSAILGLTGYYNACKPETQSSIMKLSVNGNGTRAISRCLGIHRDTVTAALKTRIPS